MTKHILSLFLSACSLSLHAAVFTPSVDPGDTGLRVGEMPREREVVSINPPAISWRGKPADTFHLQISRTTDFKTVEEIRNWPWQLYTHTSALPQGVHFWRVRSETSSTAEWSPTRSFIIPADAVILPRPTRDHLKKVIPVSHPRMLLRPENLPELRARTNLQVWKNLSRAADSALSASIMREPLPWVGGKWNANQWRGYLVEISTSSRTMETLAFAYLIGQDERHGARAKQWLLEMSDWKPLGPSGMKINDEVGMVVMYSCSRVYSWINNLLSDDEKERVREMIRARAADSYGILRRSPYEQFAFDSHKGRIWHFLGEAALAFYDEIPEAPEWLDYAMTIFYGWYPIWGDSDGGWAEGIHYWTGYSERFTWWMDQMKNVMKIDAAKKPFFAGVGEFPLHVAPPHAVISGFGDFSERPPPIAVGRVVQAHAAAQQNGTWQWYADAFGIPDGDSPIAFLGATNRKPKPMPPPSGMMLKVFRETGWAVFNTDLTDARKGVQLMLRSSPYGNISHSHADQNNIVLAAYGAPLLVNTGIRDYYGSPFCKEWYWATKAHNCLLVEGLGQPRTLHNRGEIVSHGKQGKLMFAVGDATSAYPGAVKLYRRWTAMLSETEILILDEVESTATSVQVLFHGRVPFSFDAAGDTFALHNKTASLSSRVLSRSNIAFSMSDRYTSEPMAGMKTIPEWHLTASAETGGGSPFHLLTAMNVARGGIPPAPEVEFSEKDGTVSAKWGRRTIFFDKSTKQVRLQE